MRLLLDTHVLAWWALGDERLPTRARAMIDAEDRQLAVSTASLWETAIKDRLQRADSIGLTVSQMTALIDEASITLIPVEARHAREVERLPLLHGNPFGRLLVATAIADTWRLLTHDAPLAGYGDHVILV